MVLSHSAKVQWLMEMIPILVPLGRCLIFVATRAECDNLSSLIQSSSSLSDGEDGTSTTIVSIHGDKDQRDRNLAISQFKKNSRSILIATDVASRGLDVPDVAVVVNFDAAKNMDAHVHRVGRAGRLRKESSDGSGGGQFQRGVAYTLLTEKNANFAASLADAFDREGREVSQELAALCNNSNRFGSGRVKNSKVGLGFSKESAGTSHYGPSASDQPARKRNRWG
jgi:ATP-dependent RNA helicase DDX42